MKVLSLPAMLAQTAFERSQDYMLLEIDHHGASTSRVHAELGMLDEEAIDSVLESNLAILTFEQAGDGEKLFDKIELEFPESTPIAIKVSLFRTLEPVISFEQLPGCPRTFSLPPC